MANISRVSDRLFTGGDLPSHLGTGAMLADLADLSDAGITHVIDNRMEWSDEDFFATHAPTIGYCYNGQDDAGQVMPDGWFDRGVDYALEAMIDPAARVLAHCHMGINRGPSMAYAILLAAGHDPVGALAAIRAARPIAAVGYAADALGWWHRRSETPSITAAGQHRAVDQWQRDNRLDVVRIIRQVREDEYQMRALSA